MKFVLDYKTFAQKYNKILDSISKQQRQEFFRQIELAVIEILDKKEFENFFTVLGKDKIEDVKTAVLYHDFNAIGEDNTKYNDVLRLGLQKAELIRNLSLYYLNKDRENLGLADSERMVVETFLKLGKYFDEAYIKWRKISVQSPLGKKLKKMENEAQGSGSAWVIKQKLNNRYSVLQEKNGKLTQVLHPVIFKKEYTQIDKLLAKLIKDLAGTEKTRGLKTLINYLKQYKKALSCLDIKKVAKEWEKVDFYWLSIEGKILPLHSMEYNYNDPARIRIVPDMKLFIMDDTYEFINLNCIELKKEFIDKIKKRFSNYKKITSTVKKIEQLKVCLVVMAAYAGRHLNVRVVGNCAPNGVVAEKYGLRISLDYSSLEKRRQMQLEHIEKIFDKDTIKKYFEPLKLSEYVVYNLNGHEIGHAPFSSNETSEALTDSVVAMCEESKATFSAFWLVYELLKDKSISKKKAVNVMLGEILGCFRFISLKNMPSVQPYYVMAVHFFNIAYKSGVVSKKKDKWVINTAKYNVFYEEMAESFYKIVNFYSAHDKVSAINFVEQAFKKNDIIDEIYKTLSI